MLLHIIIKMCWYEIKMTGEQMMLSVQWEVGGRLSGKGRKTHWQGEELTEKVPELLNNKTFYGNLHCWQ
jgi:hypothetical protein